MTRTNVAKILFDDKQEHHWYTSFTFTPSWILKSRNDIHRRMELDKEGSNDRSDSSHVETDEPVDDLLVVSSASQEVKSSLNFKSTGNMPSLEEMACQLEHSLPVRNNRYHLRVYKKTFVGSECVDFLVRSNFASSRPEAVKLGRRLASEFNLFEHVTLEHELKDGFYFYRFTNRTRRASRSSCFDSVHWSNDVSTVGKTSKPQHVDHEADSLGLSERTLSLHEISRKLLRGIQIKDRIYKFRTYRRCFVGSEMVDFLVQARIASSRDEAVDIGNQIMTDVGLFEHVTKTHRLEDEYLFYRFRAVEGAEASMSDFSDDKDEAENSSWGSLSTEELIAVGEQLRRGVRIKHRQYRLKTYKNCFVASDAVDYLVHSGLAQSRGHAVEIVRRLAVELEFVHHVTSDRMFEGTGTVHVS